MLRQTLLLLLGAAGPLTAQVAAPTSQAPRLFLDCQRGCPNDYIRTEIPWVDYVRSRADADIHLIITEQNAGGGGDRVTLQFIGIGRFPGQSFDLQFTSRANDTDDQQRQQFVEVLKQGLLRYVAGTPLAERFRIVYSPPAVAAREALDLPVNDPWNNWVFELGGNANFNGESQSSSNRFSGDVSAERVTDQWKMSISGRANRNENRFTLSDGEEITRVSSDAYSSILIGRSIGPRTSVGFRSVINNSSRSNFDLGIRSSAVIEFSLYPYTESTRRFVTLTYGVGVYAANYTEETVFSKLTETRPRHFAVLALDFVQPWGQADFELEAQSYLDDFKQNRVGVNGELDLRITGGLSFNAEARYNRVRDQLSLARGDASDDEILLELRQLATDFTYDLRMGLRYTFGSIFNTIVNPRFRSGDPAFGR
ncbi:MAG: hypothetical protein KJZ47_06110 [Gemmatimonadales bacterium]|nr:hypothetical protein [Gemmatimonadales bacterium]